MSANVLNVYGEIIAAVVGALVLTVFAVAFPILVRRPSVLPGSAVPGSTRGEKEGFNKEEQESGGEIVRADGYVDSFSGLVSESGGGLPPIVKVSLLALLWWLAYLILNWSQWLLSVRTFA